MVFSTNVSRHLNVNTRSGARSAFFIEGQSCDSKKQFTVTISEKQQIKDLFQVGDILEGTAWTKKYDEREFADYYRTGSLKLLDRLNNNIKVKPPP